MTSTVVVQTRGVHNFLQTLPAAELDIWLRKMHLRPANASNALHAELVRVTMNSYGDRDEPE